MRFLLAFILIGSISFYSCKKEKVNTSEAVTLKFSNDTVFFDTLLTTIGSITRTFKIYNPTKESVIISSISLGGGSNSPYSININGLAAKSHQNVKIRANDSLWGFAKITIDQTAGANPFIVADSITIINNGLKQKLDLVAWGQNAIFHRPDNGNSTFEIECDETWDKTLPHVIYGFAKIKSGCKLTITEGTNVYFYNNSGLIALDDATLNVEGTFDNPVNFQGYRLEEWMQEVAGQWRGIFLNSGSKDHSFSNLTIKNPQTGIDCDTANWGNSDWMLTLQNVKILNASNTGIAANSSRIIAFNLLIAKCGAYGFNIIGGGKYQINHATIVNYATQVGGTNNAALRLTDAARNSNNSLAYFDFTETEFNNCIIYGNNNEELITNQSETTTYDVLFSNCLLKSLKINVSSSLFNNSIKNLNPLFNNISDFDFNLTEGSPSIKKGDKQIITNNPTELNFDLNNNSRLINSLPDLGCFQFSPSN